MSKETTRKHRSPEEKVRILRLHLVERMPISEVCEKEGIHPTMFYQWQKIFFEKGTAAFESGRSPSRDNGSAHTNCNCLEWPLFS
ncbi:transposase, partial [Limnospira sp. PMC 1042.18]|uniref:transposase n=1 Tax=Limnospira sp. PMC 1042.18 TaxID=2981018 RepID=UPI0028E1704A